MLIGSVVAVMAALLLLLNGLDKPFDKGVGGRDLSQWSGHGAWSTRH